MGTLFSILKVHCYNNMKWFRNMLIEYQTEGALASAETAKKMVIETERIYKNCHYKFDNNKPIEYKFDNMPIEYQRYLSGTEGASAETAKKMIIETERIYQTYI